VEIRLGSDAVAETDDISTHGATRSSTRHFDDVGQTRSLAYVMGATTWLSFSASYSAHGQILAQSSNGSSQLFSYDNAGRLTQVADTDQTVNPIACTYDQADRISSPGYSYDPLGRTTTVPAADSSVHECQEWFSPSERRRVDGAWACDVALGS
jgi:YD repeat-containing protein